MDLETIKKALGMVAGSEWSGAAVVVLVWPILGWLGIKMLQAPWALTMLGQGLVAGRSFGVGAAAMPKGGIFRILFAAMIYAGIYAISIAMAVLDGILSKCDKETGDLAQNLITAMKKAGAKDSLLYLQHKTMEPDQAQAVKVMQTAILEGGTTLDGAQAAVRFDRDKE